MRTSLLWALMLALLLTPALPFGAVAQDAGASFQPHLHIGTCDAPGEVVADLTALTAPTGQPVGDGASSAYSAYTEVPIPFDAMTGGGYVIDVERSDGSQSVACGAVGGTLDASGALTIGLLPTSGSGYSGIAYLSAVGGGTGISTFLVRANAGGGAVAEDAPPADDATYAMTIRREVTLLVGSLRRVNDLFDTPRLDDQGWNDQLMAELTLWHILHEESRRTTPPGRLGAFHSRYVEALSLLDSAAQDITDGLANGDQARLTQAGDKIDQAVAAIRALDTPGAPASPAAGE